MAVLRGYGRLCSSWVWLLGISLKSTTEVLGTPGSDGTKIRWQGIWGTIPNGITRIGSPLLPQICCKWAVKAMSYETFMVINNIELGEGDKLINSPADIAGCAKTFVEDCRLKSLPTHVSRWTISFIRLEWFSGPCEIYLLQQMSNFSHADWLIFIIKKKKDSSGYRST